MSEGREGELEAAVLKLQEELAALKDRVRDLEIRADYDDEIRRGDDN